MLLRLQELTRKYLLFDRFWLIIKIFPKWNQCLGGKDLSLCLLDIFMNREVIRKVSISGTSLYIRTNTPDLEVAISCLLEKEYDNIRVSHPKYIIDAGANIGASAVFFSQKYPQAEIIAIEPEGSNFDMLVENTSSLKNVKLVKAALWGTSQKKEIRNRFTGHWGYTVSNTEDRSEITGQEIECITIDALMKKYGINKIDFLKMDIEGGEKDVFEHSLGWIENVEVLVVELHDRIIMGCTRAFYLATANFDTFEIHGEKIAAYRD